MLAIIFILVCAVIFNSCSKEEFSVYDQPLEDLKTSYFNYQDSTIVLDVSDSRNLMISRDETSITFQNSTVFEDLAVGSVIISSVDTPGEDFIMRKVLSISDNGGQIVLQTRLATLYEAYKSYYFDSSLPGILDTRSDTTILYDLANIFKEDEFKKESTIDNVVKKIKGELQKSLPSGFETAVNYANMISTDIALTGKIVAKSIHPNDHFIALNPNDSIFGGERDNQIKLNILGLQTDKDKDGISDVVEKFYETDINNIKKYPSISQVRIDGFSIDLTPKITFGKKFSYSVADLLGEELDTDKVEDALTENEKVLVSVLESPLQDITYIPIPGATSGAFGLAFSWHEIATFDGSISLDLSARIFSKPIDVVLGVYNFSNNSLTTEMRLERKRPDGDLESWTVSEYVKKEFDMELATIFSADATIKFGVGIGVAMYAGEKKLGLIAAGGMLTPYLFKRITAKLGVSYSTVGNDEITIANPTTFEGYACYETGIGIGSYVFLDGEDQFGLTNIVDTKYSTDEIEIDLIREFYGQKFCIGVVPCEDLRKKHFIVEELLEPGSSEKFSVKLNISSGISVHKKFTIRFEDADASLLNIPEFSGEFDYNRDTTIMVENSDVFNKFLSGNSTISMIVETVGDPKCVLGLRNTDALISHCNVANQTLNFELGFDGTTIYLTHLDAYKKCEEKGGFITPAQLEAKLNSVCMNASGFIPYIGREIANSDKLYIWSNTGTSVIQNNVTVIKPIRDDNGNYTNVIVDESIVGLGGSENSMLQCVCANE